MAITIRYFECVTTYGETLGAGWYWRSLNATDWVGPFAEPGDAHADAFDRAE